MAVWVSSRWLPAASCSDRLVPQRGHQVSGMRIRWIQPFSWQVRRKCQIPWMLVSVLVKYEWLQSIHCPSRMDWRAWTPAYLATRSLQRSTNGPMPYASMSRLLAKPSSFSTSTSTHSPCASKPFCQLQMKPCSAL